MRFSFLMKCPDALDNAIAEACWIEIESLGLTNIEEREITFEDLVKKTKDLTSHWFSHGECIKITIDTEANTCIVG